MDSFEAVKQSLEALSFHKQRFEDGDRDELAEKSYRHWQYLSYRDTYQIYLDETEGEDDDNDTKS